MRKMIDRARLAALCLVVVLGLAFAPGVRADPYRLPKDGVPAFVVDAPAGWSVTYDNLGNLQFLAADHSAAIQVTMIALPAKSFALSDLAANVFKAAGAPPYSATAPGSIAGRAGQAFTSMKSTQGLNLDLRLVLVKVDATHTAGLAVIRRPGITAAQQAVLDDLVARVTLTEH
ncbi:MAG: hypothetical protein ACREEB_18060 [Caulobacteraceae bacterium]